MQLSSPLPNLEQSDRSSHNRRFSRVGRLSNPSLSIYYLFGECFYDDVKFLYLNITNIYIHK